MSSAVNLGLSSVASTSSMPHDWGAAATKELAETRRRTSETCSATNIVDYYQVHNVHQFFYTQDLIFPGYQLRLVIYHFLNISCPELQLSCYLNRVSLSGNWGLYLLICFCLHLVEKLKKTEIKVKQKCLPLHKLQCLPLCGWPVWAQKTRLTNDACSQPRENMPFVRHQDSRCKQERYVCSKKTITNPRAVLAYTTAVTKTTINKNP